MLQQGTHWLMPALCIFQAHSQEIPCLPCNACLLRLPALMPRLPPPLPGVDSNATHAHVCMAARAQTHSSVGSIQMAGHRKSPRGSLARTSTRPYLQDPKADSLVRTRPLVKSLRHSQELSLLNVKP